MSRVSRAEFDSGKLDTEAQLNALRKYIRFLFDHKGEGYTAETIIEVGHADSDQKTIDRLEAFGEIESKVIDGLRYYRFKERVEFSSPELDALLSRSSSSELWHNVYSYCRKVAADEVQSAVRRDLFCTLADWWHEATGGMSSPTQIASHVAYQRVIAMGPGVVPLILEDLQARGGDWYVALRCLVVDPPHIGPEIAGDCRMIIATWLEWGHKHGYHTIVLP